MKHFSYWFDYVAAPIASIALFIHSPQALFSLAGAIFWTLAENVIHRAAHVLRPLRKDHARHHAYPLEYAGPGPLFTVPLFAMLVWIFGAAFVSGILAGYAFYLFTHAAIHRLSALPGTRFDKLQAYHEEHHAGFRGRFGVTTGFWDRVLG